MTENRAVAMQELLKYLEEKDTELEIVEYEKGNFDWDTKPGSNLPRREIINYSDKILAVRYDLPIGWLRTTLVESIKLGHLSYKTGDYWMEDILKFLEDKDASIILTGEDFPYTLEGLGENDIAQFNQLILQVTKKYGYLADWFILETKRLYRQPNSCKYERFHFKRTEENKPYRSDCLDFIANFLQNTGSITLYFGKTTDNMIIATTNDDETDGAFIAALETSGHADKYEQELVNLWNSGSCAYDCIRFKADDCVMVADLINRRLVATEENLLIDKNTHDVFVSGKGESFPLFAKLSSFASIYNLADKDKDLISAIEEAILDDNCLFSNIHVVASDCFPTALPQSFAIDSSKLIERAQCPLYSLGASVVQTIFEGLISIATSDSDLALVQVLLSALAHNNGISLSYVAQEKLKKLSSYNYVDNGDGTFTVVQDTKEVII